MSKTFLPSNLTFTEKVKTVCLLNSLFSLQSNKKLLKVPISDNSLSKKKEESLASSNLVKKEKEQKQSFKCQKCGKCYNWNYNLNRHMRFECGIENRFECSMCQKRFPYKQNVAIHLKRKHKLQLDNADEMISLGIYTIL